MSYSPVQKNIWNDSKFQKYDPETKLVFLYLISSKNNVTGIYEVSVDDIAHFTKVPIKKVIDVLENSFSCDSVEYDFDISTVYLKNHFKYNKSVRGNPVVVHGSIMRDIKSAFKAARFWNEFEKVHEEYLDVLRETVLKSPSIKKRRAPLENIKESMPKLKVVGGNDFIATPESKKEILTTEGMMPENEKIQVTG